MRGSRIGVRGPSAAAAAIVLLAAGVAFAGERRRVPEVVDLPVEQALAEIASAGFTAVREDVEGEPAGTVARQRPSGFALAETGTSVVISVRRGQGLPAGPGPGPTPAPPGPQVPPPVEPATRVPDVLGRTEAEALDLLRAWRVTITTVAPEGGNDGRVVDQAPAPGATLAAGASVQISVARAGAPPAGTSIVPDVVGLSQAAATRLVTAQRLVPLVNLEPSDPAKAGQVIRQEPAAGVLVARDSNVVITVGQQAASPILEIETPDVTHRPETEAWRTLLAAGVQVVVRDRLAPANAANTVLEQDPAPGARLMRGRTVTLTVGRILLLPVRVPDTMGMEATAAEAALSEAGFAFLEATAPAPSATAAGRVVGQDPPGGAKAVRGSVVRLTVGPALGGTPPAGMPRVPALTGRTEADARAALAAAGLTARVLRVPGGAAEAGRVATQTPAPGAAVAPGSEVVLEVTAGATEPSAAPLPLPQYVGADGGVAQNDLRARGLVAAVTFVAGTPDGRVVAQAPPAGTPLAPGARVTLTITRAPTLGVVALSHPPSGYSVARSYGVTFAWNPVPDAEDYQFEILVWKDEAWVVADNDVVRGVEKRPSKVRKGTYQWHIRARRAGGTIVGPWSEWRRLTIY